MSSEIVTTGSVPNPGRLDDADDIFSARIAHLKGEIQNLKGQISELEELQARLREHRKTVNGGVPAIPPVKEHEYKGLRAVSALDMYLRHRPDMKIPLSRIAQDLVAGGVNPGKPRGKQRDPVKLVDHNIRIGLPNNRRLFCWKPDDVPLKATDIESESIVIWRAPTADEPRIRKRQPSRRNTASARNEHIAAKVRDNPDLSYAEVGKLFGVGRARVQQIASRAGIPARRKRKA